MIASKQILLPLGVVVLSLTLTACGGNPKKDLDKSASDAVEESASSEITNLEKRADEYSGVEVLGASPDGTVQSDVLEANLDDGVDSKEVGHSDLGTQFQPIIFFGYDQFSINDEGLATVKHYATILEQAENKNIQLIGHTDERGTPEYNLALGEKRAKSVEEAFMLYGVNANRIEVITLGEEQPLIDQLNEAAWAKNRRVEINIK